MNSESDLLRIEVVDDEIVVSLPKSQLSVTYYKPDKSPRSLAKRMTEKYDPRTKNTSSPSWSKIRKPSGFAACSMSRRAIWLSLSR